MGRGTVTLEVTAASYREMTASGSWRTASSASRSISGILYLRKGRCRGDIGEI